MASTEKAAPCLMCLDKPAVRTVENCQHSFCEACLISFRNDNDDKACPACKGQCRQTGGLVDTICEEERTKEQLKSDTTKGADREYGKGDSGESFCKICFYRGKTVRATKACVDCRNIPMCPSCLQTHREKAETKHHVIGNIQLNPSKQHCVAHDEQLDVWCKDCEVHICFVCVPLDHSDHQIEPLAGVIRTEAEAIQTALEFEQGRFARLQGDETYLQESKAKVQNMEDKLIKAIEDHTEKVIEKALTNKVTLEKKVRATYKLIGTLVKWLDAIPELLKVSKGSIARVDKVLQEAELNSAYVETLRRLKMDLEELKSGEADYSKEKDIYKEAFKKLCKVPMKFYPRSPNMNIGGFTDLGPRCDAGGSCVCEICQRIVKLPHQKRVGECHSKGACTCGTCGSVFNRSQIHAAGFCKKCVEKGCHSHPRMANPYHSV